MSVIIIVSLCTRVLRVGFMTSLIVFSSEFTIEFYRIFVVDFLLHISRASASVEQEAQRSQRGRAMLRASDYFARSLEARTQGRRIIIRFNQIYLFTYT